MKKIVLVEDDPAISETVTHILSISGYAVECFADAAAVLAGMVTAPDLFLLDKNIAGADGTELARFIKTKPQYAGAPVVLISASPNLEGTAASCNADGFISKPFSIKQLRETVAHFIKRTGGD